MKTCPNCRSQIAEEAAFCPVCGTDVSVVAQFQPREAEQPFSAENVKFKNIPVPAAIVAYADPYDHTKDFASVDICENKVPAMLAYLLGPLGILIALLASGNSKYAGFHIRQSMKLTVIEILGMLLLTAVSFILWNIRLRALVLLIIAVSAIFLVFVHLLCFFDVCRGKAKEVLLVRSLQFLK